MSKPHLLIQQLDSIRNRFGKDYAAQKISLLKKLQKEKIETKSLLHSYYDALLFLVAYPDSRIVYELALQSLQLMENFISKNNAIKERLFNSGVGQTGLCTSFSFEIVKWMCVHKRENISFDSFDADDGQLSSILTVVLPRTESEIFQDGNENWRSWLDQTMNRGEDLLDRLVAVFDETDIRPDIRDQLWGAMGLNTLISFNSHQQLTGSLNKVFFHRTLVRKKSTRFQPGIKPIKIKLNEPETSRIIDCARTALILHLREIDPITFTGYPYVSYYQLSRGYSIALMGMVPERRSPIDCYMGYMVFKNGLPVAYAGSWILFDSGRIGLNIFPSYRGGESKYIFEQVLKLHQHVYHLNRFTVDPYQVGKDNSDGIHSGAFWIYYHAGFIPLKKEQRELAASEDSKIKSDPTYRSPETVLKKLCDSRMELVIQKKPVRFDATDLSRTLLAILKKEFNNNRKTAREYSLNRLASLLQIKDKQEQKMNYLLSNWSILFFGKENRSHLSNNAKKDLKKLFELKVNGREEDYIKLMQRSTELRKFMEDLIL